MLGRQRLTFWWPLIAYYSPISSGCNGGITLDTLDRWENLPLVKWKICSFSISKIIIFIIIFNIFYSEKWRFDSEKPYFISNGHKILKNPPKSIIHDYGVIGYFLKSWNWILEYFIRPIEFKIIRIHSSWDLFKF